MERIDNVMTDSLRFRLRSLRCQSHSLDHLGVNHSFHDLHVHGCLEIKIEDAVSTPLLEDICLNGFASAFEQVCDHLVFGTRRVDPTTYHIYAPKPMPLLEFLRVYDNVRVAVLLMEKATRLVYLSVI